MEGTFFCKENEHGVFWGIGALGLFSNLHIFFIGYHGEGEGTVGCRI